MVFNSISFSIRFAPPRVALAFEQRHVRFVKIPITCLVVITLYYYVSGKRALLLVYIIIIVYPVRVHPGILYIIIIISRRPPSSSRSSPSGFIIDLSTTTTTAYGRNLPSAARRTDCATVVTGAVGEGRRENLTLHDCGGRRSGRGRFLRLPIHRRITRNERNEKPT